MKESPSEDSEQLENSEALSRLDLQKLNKATQDISLNIVSEYSEFVLDILTKDEVVKEIPLIKTASTVCS
ncbi:hypothetical protein [Candidatus Leptofilum sp.]|uniref:hypothetical protein n=1 Tax=Candidatus Leptofilum sp. TaxID=3241576 RepID=UPI003B5B88E1